MNKAKALHEKVMIAHGRRKGIHSNPWLKKISKDSDFYKEMTNYNNECLYYQWLACMTRVLQPKTVVELGGDMGGSAVFFLSEMPEDGLLFSVDIRNRREHGLWSFVPKWDRRIHFIEDTDDSKKDNFPSGFPWDMIDLWLIDSEHTQRHVRKQMEMIKPYLKEGNVIINHDIYLEDIVDVLKEYPWDFWEDEKKIFNNGIGLHVI